MKIGKIEPLFVNVSEKSNWTFFRITTDDGVAGLGEATLQGWENVQLACLKHRSAAHRQDAVIDSRQDGTG